MADVLTLDVTVEREEAGFDRACEQAKVLADEAVERHIDEYERKEGKGLAQESMEIVFRSYRHRVVGCRGDEYSYVFGVTVAFVEV